MFSQFSQKEKKFFIKTLSLNIIISVLLVFIGVISSRFWLPKVNGLFFKEKTQTEKTFQKDIIHQKVIQQESAVINVVKKADPAVVSIIITKDLPVIEQGYDPFQELYNDPFFREFFGFRIIPPKINEPSKKSIKRKIGGGSGFIISKDGLVVTNKHVVSDRNADYTVLLNDETKFPAKVIARDPLNDLAILKIQMDDKNKREFPYLELGDSDSLQVGQTVIAIGNALGEFRNTVSKGVVSGLSRNLQASGSNGVSEYLEGVIQTDAAINQGNSGGPLLDLNGKVVGVNVAVAYGAQNIGFSIPINSIKSTIESVKKNGKIIRPMIGVRYIMVTKSLQKKNNLKVDYGAMVLRGNDPEELAVLPGSPADKAGIQEYDIILEVNGNKIKGSNTLAREILKYKVGDIIKLKILHKGKEKIVKLKLEPAPENLQ